MLNKRGFVEKFAGYIVLADIRRKYEEQFLFSRMFSLIQSFIDDFLRENGQAWTKFRFFTTKTKKRHFNFNPSGCC
jgi:hypothetical protein